MTKIDDIDVKMPVGLAQAVGSVLAKLPAGEVGKVFVDFCEAVQRALDEKAATPLDTSQGDAPNFQPN